MQGKKHFNLIINITIFKNNPSTLVDLLDPNYEVIRPNIEYILDDESFKFSEHNQRNHKNR